MKNNEKKIDFSVFKQNLLSRGEEKWIKERNL